MICPTQSNVLLNATRSQQTDDIFSLLKMDASKMVGKCCLYKSVIIFILLILALILTIQALRDMYMMRLSALNEHGSGVY